MTLGATLGGVVAILVFLTPPAEYLPEGEEPKIFANMIAPPGYNLSEMTRISEEQVKARVPAARGWRPGGVRARRVRGPGAGLLLMSVSPGGIFMIAETIDPDQIDALIGIVTEHFESYPGMRAFANRGSIISGNEGGTRSVNLDISGSDLAEIYAVARNAMTYAEQTFDNPQIGSSPGSLSLDQPLIEVRPDWARAAELGFSASELGFAVAALTDGAFVDEYFRGDDKIDMFVFSSAGSERELAGLEDLPVYTPSGQVVPLSAIADLVETVDTDSVRRLNGRRTVTLNVIPPRSTALETAVERVRSEVIDKMRSEGELPQSVSIDISGASDQLTETREALGGNYVVAIVLSFLVMVAIFGHWGWPLVILTAVPLGVAGGIAGLVALNAVGVRQPFDMITMLGFLILLGVVVNNPILIVDRTLSNLREGMDDVVEAVREAVSTRIRPIMMSMITTLFGLAPLVFIPGEGTELYRGVGVVVLSGLLFATLVTLTFLPALLVSILKLTRRTA